MHAWTWAVSVKVANAALWQQLSIALHLLRLLVHKNVQFLGNI